jgi:hypothetical protein
VRRPLLALVFALLAARQPAEESLKPAIASLREDFGGIGAVRELADGRVLIADNSSDSRLVVADLASGSVLAVGRPGNGPGEYFLPVRRLIPLQADSTLLISGARPARWSILHGARIVATVHPDDRAYRGANGVITADTLGQVLARPMVDGTRVTPSRIRNAYAILRADRSTGRLDTLGRLEGELNETTHTTRNGQQFSNFFVHVYSIGEEAVLFPDGWIAIARISPYRVEWRRPDGGILRGPEIPWPVIRVDDREKQAYIARVTRRIGEPVSDRNWTWAETVPPYQVGLMPGPDGMLVVPRSRWSGAEDTKYDLVDRRGEVARRLRLPFNERIVGFGRRAVYVAVTDDDGLQRLRKHPWP